MARSVLSPCSEALVSFLSGEPAEAVFADAVPVVPSGFPSAAVLEQILQPMMHSGQPFAREDACRVVNMAYALAATLPGAPQPLCFPANAGSLLCQLYPNRVSLEPLLAICEQLEAFCQSCDAFPNGTFHLVKAAGGVLHFTRIGPTETADAIFNRTEKILIEPVGKKSTDVHSLGFTLTVRENDHDPNHSYYNA